MTRRGRRPTVPHDDLRSLGAALGKRATIRTHQAWMYMGEALEVLRASGRAYWFLGDADDFSTTILAELGRFPSPDEISEAASDLHAAGKMSAKRAAAYLRARRLGVRFQSLVKTADALTAVLNRWHAEHPHVDRRHLSWALELVLQRLVAASKAEAA